MIKLSLLLMAGLTVLIAIGLRWREERVTAQRPPAPRRAPSAGLIGGWVEMQKRKLNRWVTAAALAAVTTMLVLGGLNWLRIWQTG